MKVALVHDYLIEYGGAERVLEALHEIFPEAPIYTAYLDLDGLGPNGSRIKNWKIKTSWLQNFPFARRLISPFRIFAPAIFEGFDLGEYDLVISSCNTYFAKAVITKPESLHLSYIHTPPRYLYGYTTSFNYKKHWWSRFGGEFMNHFLRIWDFETSQRPDILIANSKNVAQRINKFYRRESVVIYPPVDTLSFLRRQESTFLKEKQALLINNGSYIKYMMTQKKTYFLSLNRLVRGKGTEVVVDVCSRLNLPLKVAGSGPEKSTLQKLAGKTVEFVGEVTDEERVKLLASAKALVVASEDEDFGITAVESQAAGTPVIAIKKGGFLETIIPGKTGEFFESNEKTVANLMEVLKNFNPDKYKAEDCRKNAERFSKERFKKEILDLIKKCALP